jgi:hypothetical protein
VIDIVSHVLSGAKVCGEIHLTLADYCRNNSITKPFLARSENSRLDPNTSTSSG